MSNHISRIPIRLTSLCLTLMTMLWVVIPTQANAEALSSTTLGDFGNVTVMEVVGNYDARNADGTENIAARQAVAKEFFRTHGDEHDFLVIFSNFDYLMIEPEVAAFFHGVKNDVSGIGQLLFDNSSQYGSNGKLQGTIDMGNIAKSATDPLDPKFNETLSTLSHEMLHRWAAYVKFKDASGADSQALLGRNEAHWSFLLDSGGSLMYGNKWQDNGNGTFSSLTPQSEQKYYSPLDLYLMGMLDKSQIPPMLLIENPAIDPTRLPEAGVTITGSSKTVTINDIIAAMGERVPSIDASQKSFKTAFIFLVRPGTFTGHEIYGIENIRNGAVTRFSVLTDGNAIMQVDSTPKEDVPVSPGVLPPSTVPRATPPNLDEGVQWLMAAQLADGSWQDISQTKERDTAAAMLTLKTFSQAQLNYQAGLLWLGSVSSGNLDYLARKIEVFAGAGQDTSSLVQDLLARWNANNGWGSEAKYPSANNDTALALQALSVAGSTATVVQSAALGFLKSKQNSDGGWGGDDKDSMVRETSLVLSVLNRYRPTYQLESVIAIGTAWLVSKQNPDGGFGNSPSTVYDTAVATMTLRELNVSTDITNKALAYLLSQQSENNSWNNSAYQSALAISTVYKATVDPDLSIKSDDISFIPAQIKTLPANLVITANIWNLGRTGVSQTKVVLYESSLSGWNKIGEQLIAFPGQQAVTVTFPITISNGSDHVYKIAVDPDNLVKETNKLNNSAVATVKSDITYDFEILPSDLTVSANPVDLSQDVNITAIIGNRGTQDAYGVQVKYFINDPTNPYEIATVSLDIPANSKVTKTITWRTNRAGVNMPITVVVNTFSAYKENSYANNTASIPLTVNADTRANLTVSYKEIVLTPTPAHERGSVNISAIVKNEGASVANTIVVNFYRGIPGQDALLIGTQTVPVLAPGASSTVTTQWNDIPDSGEKLIYVQVDPGNTITEIRKDDNDAFVMLNILTLPDLAISSNSINFSPLFPKDGDSVTITVLVQNLGEQDATNVLVKAFEGSIPLGSQVIPLIKGLSQSTAAFTYNTVGKQGAHEITVIVDPDDVILERTNDNNKTSRTFGVQNADLWLSEAYISPNGDNIKDNTQLFFRLQTPASVSIHIVNEKNQTIRTITKPELVNTSAGSVTWDGLNDKGSVIVDGKYQMQVVDTANSVLAMLPVVVDNNQSPLTDALGTKYPLNNNLTCPLPEIGDWKWFPEESGIVFHVSYTDANRSTYSTGLYTVSSDGQDILRLAPWDWTKGNDPVYDFTYRQYTLSPDGETISFILDKFNKITWQTELSQIWTVDRNGSQMKLLDSCDKLQAQDARCPNQIKWTSQGDVAYTLSNPNELWIMKTDGTGRTNIVTDAGAYLEYAKWSLDESKIAYNAAFYDVDGNYIDRIRTSDRGNNKADVFAVNYSQTYTYIEDFQWLGNSKMLIVVRNAWDWNQRTLWLADPNDTAAPINLTDSLSTFVVSPNQEYVAFVNTNGSNSVVSLSDIAGNLSTVYESAFVPIFNQEITENNIEFFTWSHDGKKIAFADMSYAFINACPSYDPTLKLYEPHLIVVDTANNTLKEFEAGGARCDYSYDCAYSGNVSCYNTGTNDNPRFKGIASFFNDNVNIFMHDMDGYFVVNTETGDRSGYVPAIKGEYDALLSPQGRYITQYQYADESSSCSSGITGKRDLWAVSSLLNITAELRIVKQKSALILKGIAADLNFEGYRLEFADVKTPSVWHAVQPPSNVMVLNDVFTTWIPPYEGTFYVRLTVWDKAGNIAQSRKRVSWGLFTSITNLYQSTTLFSPNNDGVKDTVELSYKVLEPVHLEFLIYDQDNVQIRTFLKDYTSAGDDLISWDGRDESGHVVADGKYKIRVFDYEFPIEVDNTLPKIEFRVGKVTQEKLKDGTLALQTDLTVNTVDDKNIKYWVVESSKDENPAQWSVELSGYENVDPFVAFLGRFYVKLKIYDLVGRRFKMTAEDLAGNRTIHEIGPLEEIVAIDHWDDQILSLHRNDTTNFGPSSLSYDLAKPGKHNLSGVETIRQPLSTVTVQYTVQDYDPEKDTSSSWLEEAPVPVVDSYLPSISWDNSAFESDQPFAMRIKGIDALGLEHYSNTMYIEGFRLDSTCDSEMPLAGQVFILDKLTSLALQARIQPHEPNIPWNDTDTYKIYDAQKGDKVPSGYFALPLPADIESGKTYEIRMSGVGSIGRKPYVSQTVYPQCDLPLPLKVDYQSADDCDQVSGKAIITSQENLAPETMRKLHNISLWELDYFININGELHLMKKYNDPLEISQIWTDPRIMVANNGLQTAIETSDYPEGAYQIVARLAYKDLLNNVVRTSWGTDKFIVNRVLPHAELTYPAGSPTLCPITTQTAKGIRYAIQVTGTANDDNSPVQYQLNVKPTKDISNPYFGWVAALSINDKIIEGSVNLDGDIGFLSTSGSGGDYSLQLKVTDQAGNTSCAYSDFTVHKTVKIQQLVTDKNLFSTYGTINSVEASYALDQPAVVEVKAFKLNGLIGSEILAPVPVKSILPRSQYVSGTDNVIWDGTDDGGQAAADGRYGVTVIATDLCTSYDLKWAPVEIDNTRPIVAIAYPTIGDPLGTIVEIRGTAEDKHLQSYLLEAGEGDGANGWKVISQTAQSVHNDILGRWNTYGLTQGLWTLRLTAIDAVGNQAVTTSTVTLGAQKPLIKDLDVTPTLFSPNSDGKLDAASIKYEVTDAVDMQIEIADVNGITKRTYIANTVSAGVSSLIFDGKDSSNTTLPDGVFIVRLTATLHANPAVTQTETVTVTIDVTKPIADIKEPAENSYNSKTAFAINGTISDPNLKEYSVSYIGENAAILLDQGNQSKTDAVFGSLSDLSDGAYTLVIKARDLAENADDKNIPFTIDRTPPVTKLDSPKDGEFYGGDKNVITINGSIVEKNLDVFNLRYGSGDSPLQWTNLSTGNTLPTASQLFSWNVGKNDGIADGMYTLSLFAKDKAGLTGEVKVKVTIDNTPPTAVITDPQEGAYVKSAIEVKGTAFDHNLDKYSVEISEGQCATAFKWAVIKTTKSSVQDGLLANWQALPVDGEYCLKVIAVDKAGSTAEAKTNVKVNTHSPSAPVFTGVKDGKANVILSWTKNSEADLAGYNVYRNNLLANTSIITDLTYSDQNLTEALYTYTVKAVDAAGWESQASNEVKIKIDVTGPDVRIRSPQDGARINGLIDIKGTAYSVDDFKQYRVSIGQGAVPSTWTIIRTSPAPISYGTLVQWDTLGLVEGKEMSVKLDAEDTSGNISTQQITLTIDNTPPAKPVIISALGQDATAMITWNTNSETDLAGYLIYRNDQLANATGNVIGDLKPYLIAPGAAMPIYIDKNLPDGTFKYYVVAVDKAGNTSDPSDIREVSIDMHPPHAVILDPVDNATIGSKIFIKATSPDLDIASIQFQYQGAQDSAWTNLGGPVTNGSMAAYLDPVMLDLGYGAYHLRAVAIDKGQKTDPSPALITINYTDLTPPTMPQGITAKTAGGTVALAWIANTESDLDGYNIYRTSGNLKTKINSSVIKAMPQPSYQDSGLTDGDYFYEVTAVDSHNNESKASGSVNAKIYMPVIAQPYTPVSQTMIPIQGSNAAIDGTVSLFADTISGTVSLGTTTVDSSGRFTLNASLSLGENRISARVADSAGNVSKDADQVVVVYNDTPNAPTGLIGDVLGYDVHLAWDPNQEIDHLGYNLYRDSVKVNVSDAAWFDVTVVPSQQNPYAYPWNPQTGVSPTNPASWVLDMYNPQLISHVDIHWGTDVDSSGNPIVYAGKDFEIQVWSGYAWVTQAKVTGNTVKDNIFDFKPSYMTDKVRIFITEAADQTSAKEVRFDYSNVIKDNLIPQVSYDDLSLSDKVYNYEIAAVDNYGFESVLSSKVSITVGDVVAPSAPTLTAEAANSDITLTWTPSPETDVSGYNVYKKNANSWLLLNTVYAPDIAYIDANLSNGSYTYRVTALDFVGNESGPSNEVTVAVAVALPLKPDLSVSTTPQGEVTAAWIYTVSPASGFNLYRSLTSGGLYTRVNSGLISGTSYLDKGLVSGTTYYYVVAAVDTAGNEGGYSNEAFATPLDIIAPSKPAILEPTIPGVPITIQTENADIRGIADPGGRIDLFRNGDLVGQTTSSDQYSGQSIALVDYEGDWTTLSPDGTTLAYYYQGSIWMKTLATGVFGKIVDGGDEPVWSPDGKKIAYIYYDANGDDYRIGIYDIETSSSAPLTDMPYASESGPSWSRDVTRIAYLSWDYTNGVNNVWLKDITSGTMTQVTVGINVHDCSLSPDGTRLAYMEAGNLHIKMIMADAADTGILVDDHISGDMSYYEWSPDGKSLAFDTYRNGNGNIYIYNGDTGSQTLIDGSSGDPYYLTWTVDGSSVLFDLWDNANDKDTLWIADTRTKTPAQHIMPQLKYIWNIFPARSAIAAVIEQDTQSMFNLQFISQGQFEFAGTSLIPGENTFTVTAMDTAGNRSENSDAVVVTFDTSGLPDLAIAGEDVYLYPPYPIAGQQMSVNAVVTNGSQVDISNVDVAVYVWNALGHLELLNSETIPSIPAGSSAVVTGTWDSTGKTEDNRLVVVVDPDNKIAELNESNNLAIKDFSVADHAGIAMTTLVDKAQYNSNQALNVAVTVRNSGPGKSGVLQVQLEDENGYTAVKFDSRALTVDYATTRVQKFTWNIGTTYTGSYTVHSVFQDASGTIAENRVPFTIIPDLAIDLTIATDKLVYGPRENASTAFTVSNNGKNWVIPSMDIAVKIVDATGMVLFTDSKTASNLLPGLAADMTSVWNTGLNSPDDYHAIVQVSVNGTVTATKTTDFRISGNVYLTGNISVTSAVVPYGGTVQAAYTIANKGNVDAVGYTATIAVIDPETQTVLFTQDQALDLAKDVSKTGQLVIPVDGYALKKYLTVLEVRALGVPTTLGSASFSVKDLTPPVVTILSPAMNSSFNAAVSFAVTAADNASGVDKTEYQIDGGTWRLLSIADPSTGRYGTIWEVTVADNNSHTVFFRATDHAGNISAPVSTGFTVQIAALAPTALLNGTPTSPTNSVSAIFTVGGADVAAYKYKLDNDIYSADNAVSAPISLNGLVAGDHTLAVIGSNAYGNWQPETSATIATWTIDTQPPILTISTLADRSVTNNDTLNIAGTASDNIAVQGVFINGTAVTLNPDGTFSQVIKLIAGPNVITTVSLDTVDNTSTDTRTIILDQAVPMIVITNPPDNSVTNEMHAAVTGTVDKTATVLVRINADDPITATMINNAFSTAITYAYGQNTIEVTATDLAGNTNTAKRTVTFDNVNPAIAVTYPSQDISTNRPNILLQGTITDLTEITVSVAFDDFVATPLVSNGSFEQLLTFTDEKTYGITVTAVDFAGNMITVQRNIIYDKTPPFVAGNAVTSPTNQRTQTISGTMESGAIVSITCPTATAGIMSYPTGSTWQVALDNLTEGENIVRITATDAVGNTSLPVVATIVLDTTTPDTIIDGGPPALTNINTASITFFATEPGFSYLCSLDQSDYVVCDSPRNYTDLSEGAHSFQVRATDQAGNSDVTPAVYTWIVDTIPPVAAFINVHTSPTHATSALLQVGGADVTAYKYQLDSAPVSSETTLNIPIALDRLTEGNHYVFVMGKDAAGNWQKPEHATTTSWVVDTQAPVLILSTLLDNAVTNHAALNISGTVTDNVAIQTVSINNVAVMMNADGTFSEVISLAAGTNTLLTTAMDSAGNITTDSRTVILDQTAPVIAITSPADNSVVNAVELSLTGSVDKQALVTIQVNSGSLRQAEMAGNDFSLPFSLLYGQNTLQVTATDLAGNTSAIKRTVILDNINPMLSISDPVQDIATNQPYIMLQGRVDDITGTAVAITLDGITYTPVVTNGTFQQRLLFSNEKTYGIIVTATDTAGNQTVVRRNIIYDKTPPIVTINQVMTPTMNSSQAISGTMEAGASVTAVCHTATVGIVSYPTTTTWQVIITNMSEGNNEISVAATDPVGNASLPVVATIVIDIHTPVPLKASALTYRGPSFIAQGNPVTLKATLKNSMDAANLSGRLITVALGSQSCTGTTNVNGTASCVIHSVTASVGPIELSTTFNGDSAYLPSSDSKTVTVFAYPSMGAFVIGDRSAAVNTFVTFWGSQWAARNSLSSGSAPSSFKGYADTTSAKPAACKDTWTSKPGNNTNPPTSVPAYMAVLVSSAITKTGGMTIGTVHDIVIVKTDRGYSSNPGHAGTGRVVGVFCSTKEDCNNEGEHDDEGHYDEDHHVGNDRSSERGRSDE